MRNLKFNMPDKPVESFTDEELIKGLVANDNRTVQYIFFIRLKRTFEFYICYYHVYPPGEKDLYLKAIGGFYEYLAQGEYTSLRRFRYQASLMTYLSVVARSYFKQEGEKLAKTRSVLVTETPSVEMGTSSTETIVEENELSEILRKAIQELSPKYRLVVQLLFMEGLSYKEAAPYLEEYIEHRPDSRITPKSQADYLSRLKKEALTQLAEILIKYGYER